MEVITKEQLCREIAKEWDRQYHNDYDRQPDKKFILLALEGLDGKGTEQQIATIIGNNAWTRNRCGECGEDMQVTVSLGSDPDFEAPRAQACKMCLKTALQMAINSAAPNADAA